MTPAPSRRRPLPAPLAAALASTLATTLLLASAALWAAPAPWYKWRSKLDGATTCSQTPLGPGWERAGGPYRDSRCEKPSLAK
ncbi:hypothetical protein [Rugamonas apoptosis]|uniref:hypothetical protein n=1 Tax=Rugamonas apoptosis TaxID=2758570 RepID=UPI001E532A21|nr:hypothetical protein [Rugamonas apoptosis]